MGGSGVDSNGGGCGASHPHCLWSVTEEIMDPANEEWWHMEVVEFSNHGVMLNCVEGRAKIYKENPGIMARGVQMLKWSVKEACYSILCSSLGLESKVVRVQLWSDSLENGVQYQFLKTFSYYGDECYWSIIQFRGAGFLGDRDDGGCFPDGGDSCRIIS